MSQYPDCTNYFPDDRDLIEEMAEERELMLERQNNAAKLREATMSPFGAALFKCFKSSDGNEQLKALNNLIGE